MFGQKALRTSEKRIGAIRICVVCGLAILYSEATGNAAETNDVQTLSTTCSEEIIVVPATNPESYWGSKIDAVQDTASSRIVSLARWVDSFFDDPEYAEEEAYARASIQQSVRFYRNLDPAYLTQVRASFILPNLNRRLRLSFEGNDDLDPFDVEGNLVESTQKSVDDPSLRLQYLFLQRPDIDLGLSGGVLLSESAFYTGPRLKLRAEIGAGWDAKFTQRIYWYTTGNLKTKAGIRFDHLLGKRNLFRQAFQTDWDEEKHQSEGFRHNATSSITQPLKKSSALRYAWSSIYYTRPDAGWTSTTLSVGYRQSVWRKWIILEVAPFVTWEDQYGWDPKPGIVLSLNTIFEKE